MFISVLAPCSFTGTAWAGASAGGGKWDFRFVLMLSYLQRPDCNLFYRRKALPGQWLFIGHPDAGWRSAVVYSIIVSCRRRGINPEDYLTDVLTRLPSMKTNQIDFLLPANWKPNTSDAE